MMLMQDIIENVQEFSNLSNSNKEFYRSEITSLYDGRVSEEFIQALETITPKSRTKTVWKRTISFLKKYQKKNLKSKPDIEHTTPTQTSWFINQFYQDENAFSYISSFIPEKELKKVKGEIEWIQKVHRDNGYEKKDGSWVSLKKHSNEEVIKHLKNNAARQGRISPRTLEILISELTKRYK